MNSTAFVASDTIPTEDTSGSKTPDHFIFPSEREQLRQFKETGWSTFGGTVGDRARSLIRTAAKQLRAKAKGRCPGIVVIYNPDFMLRQHTEPHQIKAAMYGFDTIVLGLSPDMTQAPSLIDRKSGPSRMMTDQYNTTVSAVAVLDDTGLTLYHNLFAANPLHPETLKGIAVRQFRLGSKRPGEFVEWVELE